MDSTNKIISDYEIVDHGVDNPQYFQGCGIACTDYDDVATGMGTSANEALDDALEQLAITDWNVENIKNDMSKENEADGCDHCESCSDCSDQSCEPNQYYVSVRVK